MPTRIAVGELGVLSKLLHWGKRRGKPHAVSREQQQRGGERFASSLPGRLSTVVQQPVWPQRTEDEVPPYLCGDTPAQHITL